MATTRYITPKIRDTKPVQMFPPTLVIMAAIPAINRNKPPINTNNDATKLNRLGLKMNPKPSIMAKTPKVNSTMAMAIISPNEIIPAAKRPIPKNNTARPVKRLRGITPKTGNNITIKPRIIKINAPAIDFILTPPFINPKNF